jgi:hypothetical protein
MKGGLLRETRLRVLPTAEVAPVTTLAGNADA